MKVKILTKNNNEDLEKEINYFFETEPNARAGFIDIKYQAVFDAIDQDRFRYYLYSAMIIYK